jgi:C-terminal processing protease CtpA/Prc
LPGPAGSYSSGFLTQFPESFPAAAGLVPQRVVFLVRPATDIPPFVAALQASGTGAIVAEGKISEEGLVRQRTVALGEGFEALVRTTEIVPIPGWPGVHADVEVTPKEAGAAFQAALTLARDGWPAPSPSASGTLPTVPPPSGLPDKPYKEMTDPALEYRLLAVFRLWNVFHYFHPYIGLAGDWDAVLPEFIARMEQIPAGTGGRDYALTIAEMAARTADGHTSLSGNPTLDALYGEAPLPFLIRWIEGAWVVTAVSDDPAIRSHGEPEPGETGEDEEDARGLKNYDYVEVGDVVVSVDGVPVSVREDLLRRHFAASTEAGLRRKIADRLLSGPQGSAVAVTVKGRDGRLKTVKLWRGPWTPKPDGETVRLLPDNLSYVDLNRLTIPEIEGMFQRLKGTRGIVFDMRGYPNGTGWDLAARLNVRNARFGALFRRPLVTGIGGDEEREEQTSVSFSQPLPEADGPKYTGKTVLLIDERTVSQSEHLGLFFEAANGTKFVGTPTAGANGDVTYFTLPGIASVRFSGHEVRHADGRQLQRIGLVPDVLVAPTLRGVREGKDEVLERGIEVLKRELAAQGAAGSPADPRRASGRGEGTSAY